MRELLVVMAMCLATTAWAETSDGGSEPPLVAPQAVVSAPAPVPEDEDLVHGVGAALIEQKDVARATSRAIERARRAAVEAAVVARVGEATFRQHYEALETAFFTHAAGFIKAYTIPSEQAKDGVVVVEVKARLQMERLLAKLEAFKTESESAHANAPEAKATLTLRFVAAPSEEGMEALVRSLATQVTGVTGARAAWRNERVVEVFFTGGPEELAAELAQKAASGLRLEVKRVRDDGLLVALRRGATAE